MDAQTALRLSWERAVLGEELCSSLLESVRAEEAKWSAPGKTHSSMGSFGDALALKHSKHDSSSARGKGRGERGGSDIPLLCDVAFLVVSESLLALLPCLMRRTHWNVMRRRSNGHWAVCGSRSEICQPRRDQRPSRRHGRGQLRTVK